MGAEEGAGLGGREPEDGVWVSFCGKVAQGATGRCEGREVFDIVKMGGQGEQELGREGKDVHV